MKMFIYALRDRVGDSFRQVTVNESDAVVRRDFAFGINNNPNLLFMSKDLELCNIGTIDIKTGFIEPTTPIQVVCRGDALIGDKYNDVETE